MSAWTCCGEYNEHAKDCYKVKLQKLKAELSALRKVEAAARRYITPRSQSGLESTLFSDLRAELSALDELRNGGKRG